MAIPKVCGIETEYGIVVRGGDNNPVTASSLLINAYVSATSRTNRDRVGWDFEDESPANDARGFNLADVFAPEIETTLVNAVLANGARYYVDHAHPEMSTPEVLTALEAVRWDRAAEEIVRASMEYAKAVLDGGVPPADEEGVSEMGAVLLDDAGLLPSQEAATGSPVDG